MSKNKLKVYYGWAKINKVRKREAISVIFENGYQYAERTLRFINLMQNTAYTRIQTDAEIQDGKECNRMFTEFSIFLDHKFINGSLAIALDQNFKADENNVSKAERERIKDSLNMMFLQNHRGYKEPVKYQLELFD